MYYQNPYSQFPINRPQYPPVDISTFEQSVTSLQKAADEVDTILKKFTEAPFARKLMTAAQTGNQQEVDHLIKSIGTSTPILTKYTPSGILLTIHAQAQTPECCIFTMYLKWGD